MSSSARSAARGARSRHFSAAIAVRSFPWRARAQLQIRVPFLLYLALSATGRDCGLPRSGSRLSFSSRSASASLSSSPPRARGVPPVRVLPEGRDDPRTPARGPRRTGRARETGPAADPPAQRCAVGETPPAAMRLQSNQPRRASRGSRPRDGIVLGSTSGRGARMILPAHCPAAATRPANQAGRAGSAQKDRPSTRTRPPADWREACAGRIGATVSWWPSAPSANAATASSAGEVRRGRRGSRSASVALEALSCTCAGSRLTGSCAASSPALRG